MFRRFPFLRTKKEPPMFKKSSAEYQLLLERRRTRNTTHSHKEPAIEPLMIRMPPYLKFTLGIALVPGLFGVFGMMRSDYYSSYYSLYQKVTGYWLAFSGVFIGSTLAGLEILKFSPSRYPLLGAYKGASRLFVGAAQLPLGLLCISSANSENWQGYFMYLICQAVSTLYWIGCTTNSAVPSWLGTLQWPWIFYCQMIVLYLTYSLFNKDTHTARMRNLRKEISEGSYIAKEDLE